jgi:3alpha(or 20beta)-hydroxysteroid dehydrogenase
VSSLSLEDKVAIVTGGSRGMGAATARLFVAEGARVVIADVLADEGKALEAELGEAALFVSHDVSSEPAWTSLVARATEEFGGVDILINNAGVFRTSPLVDQSVEDFDQIVAINLRGVFLGMKWAAPSMRTRGGGAIVNTSSTAGLVGLAEMVAYGASKWGVRGITKVAALELGPDGIRVNSIHPGGVDTPMTAGRRNAPEGDQGAQNPLGRIGLPDDIAKLNLFLVSDSASWITGAEIFIDGGLMAGMARR